jgi:hypothetical protein
MVVRNAAAHSNPTQLARVRQKQPLDLATFKRWRGLLNSAAAGIDKAVDAYFKQLTGTGW